jgi:hypothetical protein
MQQKLQIILIAAAIGIVAALGNQFILVSVSTHGGGLDKYGCHRNNKVGNYHCHRGPCAPQTFPSQAAMLQNKCAKGA